MPRGAAPVAVMSYRAWQQRYALGSSVVGSAMTISGVGVTIAGIAPQSFFGDTLRSDPPDFFLPLAMEPAMQRQTRSCAWISPIGCTSSAA